MTAGIDHADLERFRTAVQARLGLYFDEARLGDLSDVLRARMLATHSASVSAYLARVDDAELGGLAERLTVGETYFFRYQQQFSALSEIVLPTVLREAAGRPVRILSAGCSAGDEAYSIAIALRELAAFPELGAAAARAEVRAFDVNPAVLVRAQQARYSEWSLRETPGALRQRYFTNDAQHLLAPEIRAMVRFERRNMIDEDPVFWAPDTLDIVFCRNVIMYFDAETARIVVARLTRALRPGGFLFLGHAETLRGISADYHLCHTHETFYYQRKGADAVAPRLERDTLLSAGVEPPLPMNVALGLEQTSWIDTIQQASDRIAKLTTPGTKTPPAPPAVRVKKAAAVDRVDTKPVLDMMRQERFVDALALLGTFSQNDPETQLLRAVLLTNSGELADAERMCTALLARDELHAGAHYLMALCREHAGDADAAREHDRIASYLDPAFAMPHVHVGLLERRAGNAERAAAELHRALELLGAEDAARILLFGGGFSRETLALLCQNELRRCGGPS